MKISNNKKFKKQKKTISRIKIKTREKTDAKIKNGTNLIITIIVFIIIVTMSLHGVIAYLTSINEMINVFTLDSYNITYNANNGRRSVDVQNAFKNKAVSLNPNSYINEGYHFVEWNTSPDGTGTSYLPGQEVTNLVNTTLYAIWEKDYYEIEFNSNTGTGEMPKQRITEGEKGNLLANNYTKEGYHFIKWNTVSDGSGTDYSNEQEVLDLGNIVLYAIWEVNTYEIEFNANGGSGTMDNQSMTYGVSEELNENEFTKNGVTFTGWNTSADGTGTNYADGENVTNLTYTNDEKVILYAQWSGYSIGDTVDYSTDFYGNTLNNWKVLYKETENGIEYTYLILGDYLQNNYYTISGLDTSNSVYGVSSNSDRITILDSMKKESSNWDSLLTGTINGNSVNQTRTSDVWASGAPTLELFVASWNEQYSSKLYEANDSTVMSDGLYGYCVGVEPNPSNPGLNVDVTDIDGFNNTLYFPHQSVIGSCSGYWLSTPSSYDDYSLMSITASGLVGYNNATGVTNYAFRPIIRFPSNILK